MRVCFPRRCMMVERAQGIAPQLTRRGERAKVVPSHGIEPWTSRLWGGRSDQLSYEGEGMAAMTIVAAWARIEAAAHFAPRALSLDCLGMS